MVRLEARMNDVKGKDADGHRAVQCVKQRCFPYFILSKNSVSEAGMASHISDRIRYPKSKPL